MDHRSQLLKGVLDMCLLAIISEETSYGYEMAEKLGRSTPHCQGCSARASSTATLLRLAAPGHPASITTLQIAGTKGF
jgi:hypothetical protein